VISGAAGPSFQGVGQRAGHAFRGTSLRAAAGRRKIKVVDRELMLDVIEADSSPD